MTLEEEVTTLRAQVASLKEELAQALACIAQLEQQKASPPSFVKPSTPKQDKSENKPRRKRAKEHNAGRRRDKPTQVVEHRLEQCPDCGYALRHSYLAGQRQVIELPPPQPVDITEHQVFKGWCARCEKWHYAPLDLRGQVIGSGRSKSRMGVRIASLIAYLHTTLRLPVRQIKEYLLTMHRLVISTGEIVELLHRLTEEGPLSKAVQAIKERVRTSRVVHGDETGWREKGQNGYIWCFCTPEGERYYEYDRSRAGAVARRILGATFKGVLVTDFYAAYNDYPGEHQRCWVHLLRDLHELKEKHKEHPDNEEVLEWAGEVRKLYDTAQAAVNGPAPPTQPQREVLFVKLMEGVRELALRYAFAKEHSMHPCHTLAKRLLRHQDELFQFVLMAGLSADNNLAERSIRPLVVMRKVSGGSQSPKGSATRMTLTTLFGTWRAKGLNPFTECLFLLSLNQTAPSPQL